MKKLIIIATLMGFAITAKAAAFTWRGGAIYGSDLTTTYSGTATIYAYLTSAGSDAAFVATSSATIVNGVFKTGQTNGYTEDLSTITAIQGGDNTYTFYFVITEGDAQFISTTASGTAQATATEPVSFGGFAATSKTWSDTPGTVGAWSPTPEPTSGLLLLLGMAGLALRRKRA